MAVVRSLVLGHAVLVIIAGVSIQFDPCQSPERMGNPRRNIHNELHDHEDPISDNGLTEGLWYWFDQGGDDKMPEECPAEMHCGTLSPIWMNGKHPTDFNEKEVSVCSMEGEGMCCDWKATIKVKKCPGRSDQPEHFVYKLVDPPYDDMAYCAGRRMPCDRGDVYNPGMDKCVSKFPVMDDFPELSGPIILPDEKHFIFKCEIACSALEAHERASARFKVKFTFNGVSSPNAPSQVVAGRDPVATLLESQLQGNLGKTIKCEVESYWEDLYDKRSNPLVSRNGYFAGIKTTPPSPITLTEGQTVNVGFISTIPVLFPTRRARLSLKVDRTSTHLTGSDCQVRFTETTWTGDKNSASATLVLKAIPDIATKKQPFLSVTKFRELRPRGMPVWAGYQVEDIIVNIKDERKSATCTATGDPHITTFDGTYYHHYLRGDFLLWKSTAPGMHQEIHVRTLPWVNRPTASIICAIAVREHNTILGINRCRGDPAQFITFLSETDVKRGTINIIHNKEYEIKMASGLKVKVTFGPGRYLNVHVVVLGHHFGHIEGLCGSYNGQKADDLHMRGQGMRHQKENVKYPNHFIETYRISPADSYFRTTASCVEGTEAHFSCECQNLDQPKANRYIECGLDVNGAKEVTTQKLEGQNKCVTLRRHKRSAAEGGGDADEESDDVISLDDILMPADTELSAEPIDTSQPTPSNITMSQARARCTQTLRRSPAYGICRGTVNMNDIIESCATDVMLGDSYEFAKGVKEELVTSCMIDVENNMVLESSNDDSTKRIFQGTTKNMKRSHNYHRGAGLGHDLLEVFARLTEEHKLRDVEETPDLGMNMMKDMAKLRTIQMAYCPEDCNEKGTCTAGACRCNEGYIGEACSQRADDRPQIITGDVICDKKRKACKHIRLHVEDTTETFKCRFFLKHHTGTAEEALKAETEEEIEGEFVTIGEVICRLPAAKDAREDTIAVEYTLSLANKEGIGYSEPISVTVYDSTCVSSLDEAGVKTYILKADFCLIGGACYAQDAVDLNDRGLVCDPSNHVYDWTVRGA